MQSYYYIETARSYSKIYTIVDNQYIDIDHFTLTDHEDDQGIPVEVNMRMVTDIECTILNDVLELFDVSSAWRNRYRDTYEIVVSSAKFEVIIDDKVRIYDNMWELSNILTFEEYSKDKLRELING